VQVDRLTLVNFRNYERAEVTFDAGFNLVVGDNAQGKTNLLEAVQVLSGLGSPRTGDLGALVRTGAQVALLHAVVTRQGRNLCLDVELRAGRGTRALINRTPVAGARALGEVVTTVFFGPDELALVKGPPEGRRRFLDDVVVKLRPAKDALRRELERVLRQRNALLRSLPAGGGRASALATLEAWDDGLCRIGAALVAARLQALAALAPRVNERYAEVAGGGGIELGYDSAWVPPEVVSGALGGTEPSQAQLAAALRAALEGLRARELERGQTLAGPQRDDISVLLRSAADPGELRDARELASQGDQRTCALALKLAEHDVLSVQLSDQPILLLDDVFSELDVKRRRWLNDAVASLGQVIVTSAELDDPVAAGAKALFEVRGGRVSRL
jgi:DNA replication and repair protein RecF